MVSRVERVTDNLIVVAAFFVTYHWRDFFLSLLREVFGSLPETVGALGPMSDYLIVLGVSLPLYNAFLSALGGYRSMRFASALRLGRITLFSSVLVFFSVGSFLYLLKLDLSRSFVGLYCINCFLALMVERYAVWRILRALRLRGKNFRNILIVGTGPSARSLAQEILSQPELGVKVAGFVSLDGQVEVREARVAGDSGAMLYRRGHRQLPDRVVATRHSFESALKRYTIDEVFISDAGEDFVATKELARIAVEEGVQVTLAADFFSLNIRKSDFSSFAGIPLIHYSATSAGAEALFFKRLLDVLISSAMLVILMPLFLLIALAVKLGSPGPVLFRQKRMGLNGRLFTLLKFRSMVEEAEGMLNSLQDRNEMEGPAFKMSCDPRVTGLGRFLRKYSLDELPQLWNVLVGEMSLVGPRPPLPDEVSLYVRKHRRRLSMRPGMTCIWQVSGRSSNTSFEKWAEQDLEYIDNWSLLFDLKLLLKTIPAVILARGAH